MIVLIFRGKSNVSAIMVGVLVGALLLGQDLGAMAKVSPPRWAPPRP